MSAFHFQYDGLFKFSFMEDEILPLGRFLSLGMRRQKEKKVKIISHNYRFRKLYCFQELYFVRGFYVYHYQPSSLLIHRTTRWE